MMDRNNVVWGDRRLEPNDAVPLYQELLERQKAGNQAKEEKSRDIEVDPGSLEEYAYANRMGDPITQLAEDESFKSEETLGDLGNILDGIEGAPVMTYPKGLCLGEEYDGDDDNGASEVSSEGSGDATIKPDHVYTGMVGNQMEGLNKSGDPQGDPEDDERSISTSATIYSLYSLTRSEAPGSETQSSAPSLNLVQPDDEGNSKIGEVVHDLCDVCSSQRGSGIAASVFVSADEKDAPEHNIAILLCGLCLDDHKLDETKATEMVRERNRVLAEQAAARRDELKHGLSREKGSSEDPEKWEIARSNILNNHTIEDIYKNGLRPCSVDGCLELGYVVSEVLDEDDGLSKHRPIEWSCCDKHGEDDEGKQWHTPSRELWELITSNVTDRIREYTKDTGNVPSARDEISLILQDPNWDILKRRLCTRRTTTGTICGEEQFPFLSSCALHLKFDQEQNSEDLNLSSKWKCQYRSNKKSRTCNQPCTTFFSSYLWRNDGKEIRPSCAEHETERRNDMFCSSCKAKTGDEFRSRNKIYAYPEFMPSLGSMCPKCFSQSALSRLDPRAWNSSYTSQRNWREYVTPWMVVNYQDKVGFAELDLPDSDSD